jgi:oligoendopeptidase F
MPRSSKPLGMFRKAQTSAKPKQTADLGAMPEWNLKDLYPSMDSPAFASDLAEAAAECKSFNAAYKGKLEALAKKASGAGLLVAIQRYEVLEELLGRIMAYAGLVFSTSAGSMRQSRSVGRISSHRPGRSSSGRRSQRRGALEPDRAPREYYFL